MSDIARLKKLFVLEPGMAINKRLQEDLSLVPVAIELYEKWSKILGENLEHAFLKISTQNPACLVVHFQTKLSRPEIDAIFFGPESANAMSPHSLLAIRVSPLEIKEDTEFKLKWDAFLKRCEFGLGENINAIQVQAMEHPHLFDALLRAESECRRLWGSSLKQIIIRVLRLDETGLPVFDVQARAKISAKTLKQVKSDPIWDKEIPNISLSFLSLT